MGARVRSPNSEGIGRDCNGTATVTSINKRGEIGNEMGTSISEASPRSDSEENNKQPSRSRRSRWMSETKPYLNSYWTFFSRVRPEDAEEDLNEEVLMPLSISPLVQKSYVLDEEGEEDGGAPIRKAAFMELVSMNG